MSLPLSDLTFYRMSDKTVPTANFNGVLTAIYNSLTGTTDYRGTSLPSTHLWTWATSSVGVINAVYSTALPSGSTANTFGILMAASSSIAGFTYTMISPDVDAANVIKTTIVRNPGAYSDWTTATPYTTGYAPGFWKTSNISANITSSVIRTYISQEAVFIRIIQANTTQFWTYVGAIYEPHVANSQNSFTAETDDRILGIITNGNTALGAGFLSTNAASSFGFHGASNNQAHAGMIRPLVATFDPVTRTTLPAALASGGETDLAGNWCFEKPCYYTTTSTAFRIGLVRSMYHYGQHTTLNTSVLRSGATDLYHILSQNASASASSQAIALKAAP